MRLICLFFVFSCILASSKAQWMNQTLFPGDSGYFLLAKLSSEFKPLNVLDYTSARIKMYQEIYNREDTVYCVYSGHGLYLDPLSPDPIGYLAKNGNANGINCEHTFPQSKGADQGNARSDMHHLFPSRAAVNEARSNFPFSEIEDRKTQTWFFKNVGINTIPKTNIELYSESTSFSFEPREDHKGNAARAVFYFMSMYDLQADKSFFESMRATLCDWHESDPVDSLEWTRSHLIANYQEDKANPFVLDCSLARRTYCPQLSDCGSFTGTGQIRRDLKGSIHFTHDNYLHFVLDSERKCRIIVSNSLGNLLLDQSFEGAEKEFDASQWPAGVYIIKLTIDDRFLYSQKLVKPH